DHRRNCYILWVSAPYLTRNQDPAVASGATRRRGPSMQDFASQTPIDLAHLARYTGGDRQLNADVFRLFSDHCANALKALGASLGGGDSKAWREAAHGLKGAASGIGAFD